MAPASMPDLAGGDDRFFVGPGLRQAKEGPQTDRQRRPSSATSNGNAGAETGIAGDITGNAKSCQKLTSAASSSSLPRPNLQVFCKLAGACAGTMSASLSSPVSSSAESDHLIIAFFIAIFVTSMFFWFLPEVDLSVSRWFFSPGLGFISSKNPSLQWLRESSSWVLAGAVLIILSRILWDSIHGGLTWSRVRKPIWLLSGLALGPGLIVNGLMKAHWGRPRPVHVDVFGGDAVYQMVWVISDWCDRNCSFVSGEASSSAWLVAAALVAPKPVRVAATATTLVYAGSLSLNRIAFGGHFLSDVVLAWLICGLVFAILHRLIPEAADPFRPGGRHAKQGRAWGRADPPGSADPPPAYQGKAARKRGASRRARSLLFR